MPMENGSVSDISKFAHSVIRSPILDGEILFVKERETAVKPTRKHQGDVGYDLSLSRDLEISPLGFTDAFTDIRIYLEPGFWGMITGRSSSIRKHGILVSTGIIDGAYTGSLHLAVQNLRNEPFFLEAGARIAQLVVLRIYDFAFIQCAELPETERGEKGFGSTGR